MAGFSSVTYRDSQSLDFSDDSLTELGITGFLPLDDDDESAELELANIFPTPSPCATFDRFIIHNRFKSGAVNEPAQVGLSYHAMVMI